MVKKMGQHFASWTHSDKIRMVRRMISQLTKRESGIQCRFFLFLFFGRLNFNFWTFCEDRNLFLYQSDMSITDGVGISLVFQLTSSPNNPISIAVHNLLATVESCKMRPSEWDNHSWRVAKMSATLNSMGFGCSGVVVVLSDVNSDFNWIVKLIAASHNLTMMLWGRF